MRFCYVIFWMIIFTNFSCTKSLKKEERNTLNPEINYTEVDVSPTFYKCKKLPDSAKLNCFKLEIRSRLQNPLLTCNFITEKEINETVLIDLLIDNKGFFKLKKIKSSTKIKQYLPKLDSVLKNTIKNLPKITPAFKRGIPVTTQYQLPLKIKTN
ncbi:hypothetical protein [Tenacibaculum insulae]|uniref:hypothetical protein n=1 Tax=Tenacibaculum insulae TaxID=2029677 RepID=UPI003AB1FE72